MIDIHQQRKAGQRGPENRNPHHNAAEQQPAGWHLVSVGQMIDGIQAGKSFAALNKPPGMNETGIAKISAVTWGFYNEDESKTVTNADLINEDYIIRSLRKNLAIPAKMEQPPNP